MENELQKIELKNEFRGAKLEGKSPLFIDILSKSWSLD